MCEEDAVVKDKEEGRRRRDNLADLEDRKEYEDEGGWMVMRKMGWRYDKETK